MANVTWGIDPKAVRISVYYTESSTIYEGMPVCYEFDATTNWMGVNGANIDFTTTASTASLESTSTAEGYQNEGKFIRVEDPDADNIHAFAGVVAGGDHVGQTGPRAIDIYIPNGAIVPVRTDQSCTVGRTVLCVHTAEQHLTGPYETAGRPVAIAQETNSDVDGDAGLVLAKLDVNLFLSQKADAVDLLVDDQDTGNTFALNQIKVDFASATGNCMALCIIATSSAGAAANGYGLALYTESDIEAAPSSNLTSSSHWMNITGGTLGSYQFAVGEFGVYESGANLASIDLITPIILRTQLDSTNAPGAGTHWMMYLRADGADSPDGLFMAHNKASIGAVSCTGDTAHDSGDLAIPIKIDTGTGNGTYYIIAQDSLG